MKLYSFASRNEENIRRGYEARTWAVSTVSDSAMKGRVTKSQKVSPGDKGVLFCGPLHSFTVPFIITSVPDPDVVVKDIWPEAWVLPFSIEPLGSPNLRIHMHEAQMRWPFLDRRMGPGGSVTAAMNITGATVFVPVEISTDDWERILECLVTK